jgi:hypothetical protein
MRRLFPCCGRPEHLQGGKRLAGSIHRMPYSPTAAALAWLHGPTISAHFVLTTCKHQKVHLSLFEDCTAAFLAMPVIVALPDKLTRLQLPLLTSCTSLPCADCCSTAGSCAAGLL